MTQGNSDIGVPEQSVGTILQRGGEELALEKVRDRFVVRRSDRCDDWKDRIPAQWNRSVPQADLEEFSVEADRLDEVMQAARSLDSIAFVSHVYQTPKNPETLVYLSDEVTIQFGTNVEPGDREAISTAIGLDLLQPVEGIPNTFIYRVTARASENPVKIANRLTREPQVLMAEPNIIVHTAAHYRPLDSLYHKQWYLHHNGGHQLASRSHISVERAWEVTRGRRSVVVAVADDSIDLNHPDFQGLGKIVAPRDLKQRDFLPLPEEATDNHGTACAGVCVAEETGTGVVGVAPGCALMPIRTSGYLDDRSIEEIFDWARNKGAAVISCSWGASAVYFPLSLRQRAAITRAATQGRNGKGCVVVFAAGNANRPIDGILNERGWPDNALSGQTEWLSGFAVHPDVIAVSACTSLNQKAAYSNWGPNISVCAPSNNAPPGMWLQSTGFVSTPPPIKTPLSGLGIFTADRLGKAGYDPGDFTGSFGGTSSACPVVAGVAALVLSVNPDLTAAQVKQLLQQSSDRIVDNNPDPQLGTRMGTYDNTGHSQWFGYGKVNAYKAVEAARRKLTVVGSTNRRIQERSDRAVNIPDNNPAGVTTGLLVDDSSSVRDLQVTVNLEHDFLGDVELYLIDPDGDPVLLQNRSLGRRKTLIATYSLQSTPMLQRCLGRSARGRWQLKLVDLAKADTGTLKRWQLTIGV